eukprot:scaffold60601_cov32-Tisochrysis_lutea.AAC.5
MFAPGEGPDASEAEEACSARSRLIRSRSRCLLADVCWGLSCVPAPFATCIRQERSTIGMSHRPQAARELFGAS